MKTFKKNAPLLKPSLVWVPVCLFAFILALFGCAAGQQPIEGDFKVTGNISGATGEFGSVKSGTVETDTASAQEINAESGIITNVISDNVAARAGDFQDIYIGGKKIIVSANGTLEIAP